MSFLTLLAEIFVTIAATFAVISGFGFVLFSAPLLSFIYEPVHTVLISISLSTLLLGLLLTRRDIWKHMNKKITLNLLIFSIFGLPIGIFILPYIEKNLFRMAIGLITIVYVLVRSFILSNLRITPKIGVPVAGFLGGILSTSTGLSAIPVVMVLSALDMRAYERRSTLAGFVFVTGFLSLLTFHFNGLISDFEILAVFILIPALLIGLAIGLVLISHLNEKQLTIVVLAYLTIIGIIVIIPINW